MTIVPSVYECHKRGIIFAPSLPCENWTANLPRAARSKWAPNNTTQNNDTRADKHNRATDRPTTYRLVQFSYHGHRLSATTHSCSWPLSDWPRNITIWVCFCMILCTLFSRLESRTPMAFWVSNPTISLIEIETQPRTSPPLIQNLKSLEGLSPASTQPTPSSFSFSRLLPWKNIDHFLYICRQYSSPTKKKNGTDVDFSLFALPWKKIIGKKKKKKKLSKLPLFVQHNQIQVESFLKQR